MKRQESDKHANAGKRAFPGFCMLFLFVSPAFAAPADVTAIQDNTDVLMTIGLVLSFALGVIAGQQR